MSKKEGDTQLEMLGRVVTFILSKNCPEVFTLNEVAKATGTHPKTLKNIMIIGNEFQHVLPPFKIVKDYPLTFRRLSKEEIEKAYLHSIDSKLSKIDEKLEMVVEKW